MIFYLGKILCFQGLDRSLHLRSQVSNRSRSSLQNDLLSPYRTQLNSTTNSFWRWRDWWDSASPTAQYQHSPKKPQLLPSTCRTLHYNSPASITGTRNLVFLVALLVWVPAQLLSSCSRPFGSLPGWGTGSRLCTQTLNLSDRVGPRGPCLAGFGSLEGCRRIWRSSLRICGLICLTFLF